MSTTTTTTQTEKYNLNEDEQSWSAWTSWIAKGTSDPPAQDVRDYIQRQADDNDGDGSSLNWSDYQCDERNQEREKKEQKDPGFQRTDWPKDDLNTRINRRQWKRLRILNSDRIPDAPIQKNGLQTPTDSEGRRESDDKRVVCEQIGDRLGCMRHEIENVKEHIERTDVDFMGSHSNVGTAVLSLFTILTYENRAARQFAMARGEDRMENAEEIIQRANFVENTKEFIDICKDRRPEGDCANGGTLHLITNNEDGDDVLDQNKLDSATETLKKNISHRDNCKNQLECDCIPCKKFTIPL